MEPGEHSLASPPFGVPTLPHFHSASGIALLLLPLPTSTPPPRSQSGTLRRSAALCRLRSVPSLPRLSLRSEYDVNVEVLANLGVVDTHAEPDFVRNYIVGAGWSYLRDVLKEFDYRNKLNERAEHVLRAAEVKYCFECGGSRECLGCYQAWHDDSAKVTRCQGHFEAVIDG